MPTLTANGIDINYVDTGRGEPLVLVHNLISNIHGYDFNIPEFAKHYRVIAYDHRGHGLSSKLKDGYNFENMTEDLYQLLKDRGVDSCYLLGTAAVGVGVILTFFLRHPEMVRALIPVSGAAAPTRAGNDAEATRGDMRGSAGFRHLQDVARQGGMRAVLEERKRTMTFWTAKILDDPEIWNRFVEMYDQTSVDAFLALPERFTEERWAEIAQALTTHDVPLLQIVGIEDGDPQRIVDSMKRVCPRTHGVILPDSGHYPAIENPQDFNHAVLNFLAGVRTYS